jgi:hypothetical protein
LKTFSILSNNEVIESVVGEHASFIRSCFLLLFANGGRGEGLC